MRRLLGVLFLFTVSLSASARGEFGPEWTFTNDNIIQLSRDNYSAASMAKSSAQAIWLQKIAEKCRECSINDDTVTINEDFWFKIGSDPFVLEVTAAPLTVIQFAKNEKRIQQVLFDTAKEAGLAAHNRLVGGHIHIDRSGSVGSNELLKRNFIVDLFNNPELFMGAFSHDYLNAPPLAIFKPTAIDKFEVLLADYDARRITYDEFEEKIKEIYGNSGTIQNDSKYQALNLDHSDTYEIRGFQPQKSAKHHLAMIRLLDKRIDYLRGFSRRIKFERKDYRSKVSYRETRELHKYTTTLRSGTIVSAYRDFVEEAGLDWEDYKEYYADERLKRAMASSSPGKSSCKAKLRKKSR